MDEVRIIELKESVFADNDRQAEMLREELRRRKCFLLNVMSSPGSGKTSTLIRLIEKLKPVYRIAVMEADIDGAIDAEEIAKICGVEALQLHTGGMCHLDAGMTKDGLDGLTTENPDIIFLENVGNLVCPAEFDTGASKKLVLLSIPEGDDKPHKYPLMFEQADVVVINKIDVEPYFDFSRSIFESYLRERNPSCKVFYISAKTGEGIDALSDWLRAESEEWSKKDA